MKKLQNKKQVGRPAIEHNDEVANKVQSMAQYGATQEHIAIVVDMSSDTLRKLYSKELAKGKAMANLLVGKKLFERCQAGDTASLIFWAKTQMGWKETTKTELTGVNGEPLNPIKIQVNFLDGGSSNER